MVKPAENDNRAICDYEGTSYRANFWEGRGRDYEDLAERVALRQLLPGTGYRLLEVGAGFGRLADLYDGYQQVILLDYAKSGLREAQERLGRGGRFIYVAADLYHLPLQPAICDTVVTVRVLHHVIDVPSALRSLAEVLRPGGTYVLEFANKRNIKAMLRFWLRRQDWSPFNEEPIEFTRLNFDFHPGWMARQLAQAGFRIEAGRAVSLFRQQTLKRLLPATALAAADGWLQVPGAPLKITPSVFWRCTMLKHGPWSRKPADQSAIPTGAGPSAIFRCPRCGSAGLRETPAAMSCGQCGAVWPIEDGIYVFKETGAESD